MSDVKTIDNIGDLEPTNLDELMPDVEDVEGQQGQQQTQVQQQTQGQQGDDPVMSSSESTNEPTMPHVDDVPEIVVALPTPAPPVDEEETDKLNSFYFLKTKYEEDFKERCHKNIMMVEGISWKTARKMLAKCKPKCINCKRRVGSIFSIKYTKTDSLEFRKFIGKCGDPDTPCAFNIDLEVPITKRLDELYATSMLELNKLQESVIVAKNKAVFGIIDPTEAVATFDSLKADIDKYSVLLEQYMNKLFNVIQNPAKRDELDKKRLEFNDNVREFKTFISKHIIDDEPIKQAMDYYAEILIPSAFDLSKLTYAHREVVDSSGHLSGYNSMVKVAQEVYTCISFPFLPVELEITEDMRVINFNVGDTTLRAPVPIIPDVHATTRASAKTTATTDANTKTNAKTKTKKMGLDRPVKNKTIRKTDMNNITTDLDDLFVKLIMDDRITQIKIVDIFKILTEEYNVKNVKDEYGHIVKNYFRANVNEWERVREDIKEVAYKMAIDKIPRGRIYELLKMKNREEHPDDEPIDYIKKYKQIIVEMQDRYDTLLETESDPIPRPNWPQEPYGLVAPPQTADS
jgi:hypothetical protein